MCSIITDAIKTKGVFVGLIIVNDISELEASVAESLLKSGHKLLAFSLPGDRVFKSELAFAEKGLFWLDGATTGLLEIAKQKIRIHPDKFAIVIPRGVENNAKFMEITRIAKQAGSPLFYNLLAAAEWI